MATEAPAPEEFQIPVPPVEAQDSAENPLGRGARPKELGEGEEPEDPLAHLKPKEGEEPEGTPPQPGLGAPGDIDPQQSGGSPPSPLPEDYVPAAETPAPAPAPAPPPPPPPESQPAP